MSIVEKPVPPLVAGERLSREEFMRRWEAMPQVKRAELIGGVVYMPSPLKVGHSASTPGCAACSEPTTFLLEDVPQPDVLLRLLPEAGGRSRVGKDGYLHGPPELTIEVSLSRTSYDLREKLELYQSAGVKEYLTVLPQEQEVRWHRLVRGKYRLLPAGNDGVLRSVVFPGLWLHAQALLQGDLARVLTTLNEGLASPEHQAFVAKLARRKRS